MNNDATKVSKDAQSMSPVYTDWHHSLLISRQVIRILPVPRCTAFTLEYASATGTGSTTVNILIDSTHCIMLGGNGSGEFRRVQIHDLPHEFTLEQWYCGLAKEA